MLDTRLAGKYLLDREGTMTTARLSGLLYVAAEYHADRGLGNLYTDTLEAWPIGPVSTAIEELTRGIQYLMTDSDSWIPKGPLTHITSDELDSLKHALDIYAGVVDDEIVSDVLESACFLNARSTLGLGREFGPKAPIISFDFES